MNDTMGKVFFLGGAGRVGLCERCGDLCKVAERTNADARMLKHAETPKGCCPCCHKAVRADAYGDDQIIFNGHSDACERRAIRVPAGRRWGVVPA